MHMVELDDLTAPPDLASPFELRASVHALVLNYFRTEHLCGELLPDRLLRWAHSNSQILAVLAAATDPEPTRANAELMRARSAEALFKRLLPVLREELRAPPPLGGDLGHNFALLCEALGLVEAERQILQLVLTANHSEAVGALLKAQAVGSLGQTPSHFSPFLPLDEDELRLATRPTSTLFASKLIQPRTSLRDHRPYSLDSRVRETVFDEPLTPDRVLSRFVTVEPPPELGLDDFGPVRLELGATVRLLEAALRKRQPGVNILFVGPTGTGKTEAARVVARAAGLRLYLAGGAKTDGTSPNGRQRLVSLLLGNRLLGGGPSALLFDELEDLERRFGSFSSLGSEDEGDASKLWINRLLETNTTPTLWTTNDADWCDPALRRRFTLSVQFGALTRDQRRRVWSRVAGSELAPQELDELATVHASSPGEMASAVRTARLVAPEGMDRDMLKLTLEASDRLQGRSPGKAVRAGAEYRAEAVNASRDLPSLTERLCAWRPGTGGLTLCLYGRSGTGKSEYVHHLAQRMDRPLVVCNVSDLQSKWLGDAEKNIARAFAQAAREGSLLLFDEADTFISDRRGATHAWERSQANEFLQQLESCRGFVAVTTNLYKGLDPAMLRRFLFKVEFLPLRSEQRLMLWDAHLARFLPRPLDEAERRAVEAGLREAGALVPADFGVVARRMAVLGGAADAGALLRELEAEVLSRGHDERRNIGFRDAG